MKTKSTLTLSALLFLFTLGSLESQAALLGTYTFAGGDPGGDTIVPIVSGMTFSPLSRVNLTANNASGVFRSTDWNTGGAIDTTEYVQFVLTPDSTHLLQMESISFKNDRNGGANDGPNSGRIEIFLGAGLTSKGSLDFTPTTGNATVNFDFADFSTALGESVTVRFYGWNAGASSGRLDLDNVAVSGVVAVPEPVNAALALFVLCVAGVGIGRRIYARVRS